MFDTPVPDTSTEPQRPVRVNAFPMLDYVDSADTMPTSLDPNAPPKVRGMGGTKLSPDSMHKVGIDKKDAERLLLSKEMDTRGDGAVRAMDLLVNIPAARRGEVIDSLDDTAFKNLLQRVPPDQRSAFSELVATSKNPERKLRLWKEAHLSKARNAVNVDKGDVGVDDLQTEYDRTKLYSNLSPDKQSKADDKWEKKHKKELNALTDDDGIPLPDKKRTSAQQASLKSHIADVKRATHTKEEVDFEVKKLMPSGKTDELTLAQVDELIHRKDREYDIERRNNLDLSTSTYGGKYADQSRQWSEKDLDTIERTLSVLPSDHTRGRDRLAEIWRSNMDDVNGRYHNDENKVEIANPTLTSADVTRKKVGTDYVGTTDPKVSRLELTLTHEIGHSYAHSHEAVFEKFKTAAGWQEVNRDALGKDGVKKGDIDALDATRKDMTNAGMPQSEGKRRTYGVNHSSEDKPFWGVDKSAIPESFDWQYSRVNPAEHFAEVYEMAVHDPAKLHHDMVSEPAAAAKKAHDDVAARKKQIEALGSSAENQPKVQQLRAKLAQHEAAAEEADRAVRQRGDQFAVMRNDVFGTDKAAKTASSRLQLRNLGADRIREFEQKAAELSTPAQIETLEAQYR